MKTKAALLVSVAWASLTSPAMGQIRPVSPDTVTSNYSSPIPLIAYAWSERNEATLLTGLGLVQRLDSTGALATPVGNPLNALAALAPDVHEGLQACWSQTVGAGQYAVVCQRLARDLTPRTAVTHIAFQDGNSYPSHASASDPQGNLVVAWINAHSVAFRLWYSTGDLDLVGQAFPGLIAARVLAVRFADGHFTLVAQTVGPPSTLWAQSFSLVGAPLGPATLLFTPPANEEDRLFDVAQSAGRVALVWRRQALTSTTYVSFFDEAMAPLGPPQALASAANVGCDGRGRCLVNTLGGVQVYAANGVAGQFVPSPAPSFYTDIGVSPSGDFTLAWSGAPTASTTRHPTGHVPEPVAWGVHVQRFGGPPKGDLDTSGMPDILLQNATTRAIEVWPMNGATRSAPARTIDVTPGSDWQVVGTDDFDGDWRQDVVLWNSTTGAVEIWYLGGAEGTTRVGSASVSGAALPAPASGWRVVATGDFDANGWPDLLWSREADGHLQIWSLKNAVYQATLTPNPAQAVDTNWRVVATLDFDNDGRRDLLWYNRTSGRIVFWYLDGALQRFAGRFASPPAAGDNNWTVVAAGDWGNGASASSVRANDLLWRNATSGRMVMWHLDPSGTRLAGSFTSPDAPDTPLAWNVVGPR